MTHPKALIDRRLIRCLAWSVVLTLAGFLQTVTVHGQGGLQSDTNWLLKVDSSPRASGSGSVSLDRPVELQNIRPRRTTQSAEGTTATTASAPATASTSETKQVQEAALQPPPVSPFSIIVSAGTQSRFIYHGVDIVGFNSVNTAKAANLAAIPDNFPNVAATSPIGVVDANIGYRGFTLGVSYIEASTATIPLLGYYNYLLGRFNATNPSFPKTAHYTEVDFRVGYSHSIVKKWLDFDIGYNAFYFPNSDFRNTSYQGEGYARVSFIGIPYTTVSVTYYYDHSDARVPKFVQTSLTGGAAGTIGNTFGNGQNIYLPGGGGATYKLGKGGDYLTGSYIDLKVESAFPVHSGESFSVAFKPFILIGYNSGLASQGYPIYDNAQQITGFQFPRYNGFNDLELGLQMPIGIGKHFFILPNATYGFDISSSGRVGVPNGTSNTFGTLSAPKQQHIWGGVKVGWRF